MAPRRRSIDSSSLSSSSSSESDSSYRRHKVKKKRDKKGKLGNDLGHHDEISSHASSGVPGIAVGAAAIPQFPTHPMSFPEPESHGSFPEPQHSFRTSSPPPYGGQPVPPPSGYRIPLTTEAPFPEAQITGIPPFFDADGISPVFVGSALLERSVHPCKIGPHLQPFAAVPYGGGEYGHHGRYDLLPFRPDQMEFVPTSHGRIPKGRRPIEGGYEEGGEKLYHAVAIVHGVKVPGKTGEHLSGARVAFGGVEHSIDDNYEILCWR